MTTQPACRAAFAVLPPSPRLRRDFFGAPLLAPMTLTSAAVIGA